MDGDEVGSFVECPRRNYMLLLLLAHVPNSFIMVITSLCRSIGLINVTADDKMINCRLLLYHEHYRTNYYLIIINVLCVI